MSVYCTTRVWEHSKAKAAQKLVLLAIADFADRHGLAWPGQDTLADMAGIGTRYVKKIVAELEDAGELWRGRRGTSTDAPNAYIVLVGLDREDFIEAAKKAVDLGCDREELLEVLKKWPSGNIHSGEPEFPSEGNQGSPDPPSYPPNNSSLRREEYEKLRAKFIELFPNKPAPRPGTESHIRKVSTRMRDAHFRHNWEQAMTRASRSKFLRTERWFDFGWFVKNELNWEKCLNGNYDDAPRGQNGSGRNRNQRRESAASSHARGTGAEAGETWEQKQARIRAEWIAGGGSPEDLRS